MPADSNDAPVSNPAPTTTDTTEATTLVAAISALTTEIAQLREAVVTLQAGGVVSVAQVTPTVQAAKQVVKKTPIVEAPSLEQTESDRMCEQIDVVLSGVFMACGDDDEEGGFEAFLQLMHTDRTDAPRSIPSLREFTWKSLRKNRAQYLDESGNPASFTVGRRVPDSLTAADRQVKLFLLTPGRSPVPVSFRRDKNQDDEWRLTDSSL